MSLPNKNLPLESVKGFIRLCPNGMVHLSYGQATLHFTITDFLNLFDTAHEICHQMNHVEKDREKIFLIH